jgi:hypothetical protein
MSVKACALLEQIAHHGRLIGEGGSVDDEFLGQE